MFIVLAAGVATVLEVFMFTPLQKNQFTSTTQPDLIIQPNLSVVLIDLPLTVCGHPITTSSVTLQILAIKVGGEHDGRSIKAGYLTWHLICGGQAARRLDHQGPSIDY
ncbi:hypothetical protein J6590_043471 [Homalodisca vitripennis]|nr:hypothetical protein J6590_043471 [Homalodisca vitripennis]